MNSVGRERVERKLAAILASDVAGYSRLMSEDEEGTLAARLCRGFCAGPTCRRNRPFATPLRRAFLIGARAYRLPPAWPKLLRSPRLTGTQSVRNVPRCWKQRAKPGLDLARAGSLADRRSWASAERGIGVEAKVPFDFGRDWDTAGLLGRLCVISRTRTPSRPSVARRMAVMMTQDPSLRASASPVSASRRHQNE